MSKKRDTRSDPSDTPATEADDRSSGAGPRRELPTTAVLVLLGGIFGILLVGFLWFTRPFFLPALTAFVLMLMLAPVVGWLKRRKVPEGLGALGAVFFVIFGLQIALGGFLVPLSGWMERAPQVVENLERRLDDIASPIESATKISEKMQKAAEKKKGEKVQKVEINKPGIMQSVLANTPPVLAQFGLAIVLLYFMLAFHSTFRERLILVQSHWADKLKVARIVNEVEQTSSIYLFTITAINIGLGVCVGLALWASGMPDPLLWGVMMAILNFVPYIGPLVVIALVAAVALAEIPPLWLALLQPLIVFILHLIEGVFVTPHVLGRRLSLNPFVVILNLSFWGWLWGPVGAMISVPMLLFFSILCSHIDRLAPVALFLGDPTRPPTNPKKAPEAAPDSAEAA